MKLCLRVVVCCALVFCGQCGPVFAAQSGQSSPVVANPVTTIDASIRRDVLRELARALESRYAIESTAKRLAEVVRARQKADAYRQITSAPEFARALTNDMAVVAHDKHLQVFFSFAPVAQRPDRARAEARLRALNGAIPKVEILDGNVGYMRVNGVPDLETARSAVAAAFAFLRNTDALIIDNRANGGGDSRTVALYVSYLSEGEPFVVNTFPLAPGESCGGGDQDDKSRRPCVRCE